jgi:gamma-glutamyltranspeptidase/glutathione hydrolase
VDAAVAAIATQGVVAPETCGVGGDLFALVHRPGWERPKALNSSGRAGSGADPEALRRAGLSAIPRDHPATVTVPGCVDGLQTLIEELGALDLSRCLDPAIDYANGGFEVTAEQARAFGLMADFYADNPAVSEFYPDGRPVKRGDRIRRSDLARTLESVADGGRDAFYLGEPGADIVGVLGGLITKGDLAQSCASWIDPIGCEVAGLTAWTTPPNSQGYLAPAMLAVFEMLGVPDDPNSPEWWHLLIEAYRSLAWERNDVVADPEHAPLPNELLLDRSRLERAAGSVDRKRAGVWPASLGAESGTAYPCVVDADGMTVSMIQSNYRGTGSVFGAPNSGFLLQDRGGGFSLMPGHPNELGQGKRPLHTLSPTLWTDGEEPRWAMGTRGGSVQPQLVAQVAARAVVAGLDLEEAQTAPRWTVQQFGPDSASRFAVEPGVAKETLGDLRERGHEIDELDQPQPGWGPLSIIEVDGGVRRAAVDPRVETTTALLLP